MRRLTHPTASYSKRRQNSVGYGVRNQAQHAALREVGRELTPGEAFYSVLMAAGSEVVREDYSADAWEGPPEGAIGWWKARVPQPDAKRVQWAPNEVMLQLFEDLEGQAGQSDLRYVLTLLLIRRRVMRLEETEQTEQGEVMVLYCPRREAEYRASVVMPTEERVREIQEQLAALLFAGGS